MKALIFLVSITLMMPTFATETNGGYVACRLESDLDLVIRAAGSDDRGSFKALVDGSRCSVMRASVKVTVIDYPGMFGGKASFMVDGVKFWTVREGLNFKIND